MIAFILSTVLVTILAIVIIKRKRKKHIPKYWTDYDNLYS
jgi:hypothetical protein